MQIVLMKFSALFFYLGAVLLLDACGFFRFGLFFVGGYMCNNFMGFVRSAQKACFRAKNGKNYENRPILTTKF